MGMTDSFDQQMPGSAVSGPAMPDGPSPSVRVPALPTGPSMKDLDPLTVRPRTSSRVLCLVSGLALLALSALVWWLAVFTIRGQEYDDEVWNNFKGFTVNVPWIHAFLGFFTSHVNTTVICVLIALVALVVAFLRKRWWLLGQMVVYAAMSYAAGRSLKILLPRPFLVNVMSSGKNSAPSGHTIMAVTVFLVLLCVVPRVWRGLTALLGVPFTLAVGCSVIQGKWHRPSDVVMGILIAGGLALIALAFTRGSGMDATGTRMSSASVQIISTVLLTAGLLGVVYGAFVIWQMDSGLQMGARWTFYGAHCSAVILIASTAGLVAGLVLALRQVTASPLTRLGLVGEPPAPPRAG